MVQNKNNTQKEINCEHIWCTKNTLIIKNPMKKRFTYSLFKQCKIKLTPTRL